MDNITVKITGSTKSWALRKKFSSANTVHDVKVAFCNQEGKFSNPEEFNLRNKKTGKILGFVNQKYNDQNTLQQCGVKGKLLKCTLTSSLNGGAEQKEIHVLNSNRARKLDKSDPDIKVTNKECCVYGDKEGDRAEMPCGHAFTPNSMFQTLKALLRKNDYEYIIKCPQCAEEMDFDVCAKIADFNDEEWEYFLDELGRRSEPELQPCPDCGIDCERPEKLTMMRVNCSSCSGGDWCFICAQKWRASGFTVCGNKDCELYDINDVLQNCPLKEASAKVMVPEVRACPKCLDFIDHKDLCKHMECKNCGLEFCFACLKPKKDGKWQCGSHTYQCVVAPRQKF